VTHYNDPAVLAEISRSLGEPMVGINISEIPEVERLAVRGW
jgi:pyridoxal 5'-phosphate synthase pdxS subunit